MNIAEAIQYLYPNAIPRVDFDVFDESDGAGPHLENWNVKVNGAVVPEPTSAELTDAYAASLVPSTNPQDYDLNRFQFEFMIRKLKVRDAITAALAAMPEATEAEEDAKIEAQLLFEQGTIFRRKHPLFTQLAPAVGLTPSQVDTAWLSAKDKAPADI